MFVLDKVWLRSTFEVAFKHITWCLHVVLRPPKRCFYDLYGTTLSLLERWWLLLQSLLQILQLCRAYERHSFCGCSMMMNDVDNVDTLCFFFGSSSPRPVRLVLLCIIRFAEEWRVWSFLVSLLVWFVISFWQLSVHCQLRPCLI